ncbi:MAG: phosphatase PAP2 family protein [Blautia wexlerae]
MAVQYRYSYEYPAQHSCIQLSCNTYMSLTNCEALRNKKLIKAASFTLTALIIMSTMFLKQHSVIDVCMGATLALFGFWVFYPRRISVSSESVCFREVKRKKSEN